MKRGSETELDASLVSELMEVAAHIKANSIERGRVTLQEAQYIDWEATLLRSWRRRGLA